MSHAFPNPDAFTGAADPARRVVVVGAGMGGLAATMVLAGSGLNVTVVESAAGPGGKMRVVESEAGPIDAGPTVLTLRGVFDSLFTSVGETLEDHVTLIREPVIARHWWPDGSCLDLHDDHACNAAAIERFGGARAAQDFAAFDRRAASLFRAFDQPMMRTAEPDAWQLASLVLRDPSLLAAMAPGQTLASALRRQFRDPRLRQLFGRYATYVGGSPYQSPAILALIWRAEVAGVWHARGGLHALARAMEGVSRARGARFVYGAKVGQIEVSAGRVVGVRLADGGRISADHVVFNGDPAAIQRGLLGPDVSSAVRIGALCPRSLSAQVWSFAARPSGPELATHNVFFAADPRSEFDDLAAGRTPKSPTIYVHAQDRGHAAAERPQGLERFEIILNAPPARHGAPLNPEEPERCRDLTFATLARFGLTFDPVPPAAALTMPQGFAQLFPGSDGSLYGRSPHGLMAAFRRPLARTSIPGLYLAGGGAHPGAGVPMAALSGQHAAETILMDLASILPSHPAAMPGGTSTGSRTTARGRYRS